MKRIILFVAFACMACISAVAQTSAQAMLIHGDSVKMFDATHVQDAIDQATAGDVIKLTAGGFLSFNVTKAVSIQGSGQGTVISGNISVNIPNTPTLVDPVLKGMYIEGDVTLDAVMDGVKISQCKFRSFHATASNPNVIIDRCYLEYFYTDNLTGGAVWNSKVTSIGFAVIDVSVNYFNCNILDAAISGSYDNCIIYQLMDYGGFAFLVNCLYLYGGSGSLVYENCWQDYNLSFAGDMECEFSTEELIEKGYIGTDGTPVGIYGGSSPYTLTVPGPKVVESDVKVVGKELKVNLSVVAN